MASRTRFHEELEKYELELHTMGELAGAAVRKAVDAVLHHDEGLANGVIQGDDEIDSLYLSIDHGMLALLALQAPVASDLRLVSVLLHSNQHLERIGDQAVNIAKLFLVTKALPTSDPVIRMIGEMGDISVEMVRVAIDALRGRDMELSLSLPEMDDPVDRLNRHVHLEVAKLAEDHAALDWGMHMIMVARALERVGDNAVDIAQQVAFLLSGEYREFSDASHPGTVLGDAN